jgi:predicted RNA-binding Zn-ribbon protein involved in translation (DUF1610 family)
MMPSNLGYKSCEGTGKLVNTGTVMNAGSAPCPMCGQMTLLHVRKQYSRNERHPEGVVSGRIPLHFNTIK